MSPRQQSILIGALVVGLLGTSYLSFINTLCCLGVIVGGMVTTQQWKSRSGRASVEPGTGAILGAMAGAGGAVLSTVFNRVLRPLGLDAQSISQGLVEGMGMTQGMEGQAGNTPQFLQQLQNESGVLLVIANVVFGIIINSVFGAVGGAIGAALLGDEESGNGGVQTAEAEVIE